MTRQPALFVSQCARHAAGISPAGRTLTSLGRMLPRPRAVLIMSPYWVTHRLMVSAVDTCEILPNLAFDSPGNPAVIRPPGQPQVARRVVDLMRQAGLHAELDLRHGLDHGAWGPLQRLFPRGDVPVVQISMPSSLDARGAWTLGRILAPLAGEDVLIVGCGCIANGLLDHVGDATPRGLEYAQSFALWVRRTLAGSDRQALADYLSRAPHAARVHPTPEFFLPLPFAAGAAEPASPMRVCGEGSLAGNAYLFGDPAGGSAASLATLALDEAASLGADWPPVATDLQTAGPGAGDLPGQQALVVQRPDGVAAQLILLLHGNGADAYALEPFAQRLASRYPRACVVCLQAPLPGDGGQGFTWYSLRGVSDANHPARVDAAMPALLDSIAVWQRVCGVPPQGTVLIGFAQGALMALESLAGTDSPARCVVAIAGRYAGAPVLPPAGTTVHFIHGKSDGLMPYVHSVDAAECLRAAGIDASVDILPFVGHGVNESIIDLTLQRLGDLPDKPGICAADAATGLPAAQQR